MSEQADPGPAWARATEGEPRWHASLLVLAIVALQVALPPELTPAHGILAPLIELALLVLIFAANPRRITGHYRWVRYAGLLLIVLMSLENLISMVLLVEGIVNGAQGIAAPALLLHGGNIWLTNVLVFALWYWELDRGGPAARAEGQVDRPDFLFPQMGLTGDLAQPDWEPRVFDYLYTSFTNATAFSPTDTMPLSRWAKAGMMLQSAISLGLVALVVARAVNILA